MTRAQLLAALGGMLAVAAAWEGLGALEAMRLPAGAARALLPLRRARREGREPTAPERRRLAWLASATLLGAGWLLFGPVVGLLLAAGGPPAVLGLARARRRRYLAELEQSAPAAARALADAVAGGHSVRGAIAEAARGVPGAGGAELRAAAGELALGEPTERALEGLRSRAGSGPWETTIAAILLTRESGGDLVRLLRGMAAALEESHRLEHDARSATAQARFTGVVVFALPVGAALLAELASPGYLSSLAASPLSAWLAGTAMVLQALAMLAIHRLARVRG